MIYVCEICKQAYKNFLVAEECMSNCIGFKDVKNFRELKRLNKICESTHNTSHQNLESIATQDKAYDDYYRFIETCGVEYSKLKELGY